MRDPVVRDRPARPPRGTRRSGLWAGVVLIAATLLAGRARAVESQIGPPPWRAGGRLGFTCDAAVFPDTTGYHLEVYLRLPPATLRQLSRDASGVAQVRATLHVSSRFSARELESSQDFNISLADTVLGQGRVMLCASRWLRAAAR
jgi:hypothetical protein